MVENKQEEAEALQLREICTNYLIGLTMEAARKERPKASVEDQVRIIAVSKFMSLLLFYASIFISQEKYIEEQVLHENVLSDLVLGRGLRALFCFMTRHPMSTSFFC